MTPITTRFKRQVPDSPEYSTRLQQELDLILLKGFTSYFHKVLDVLDLVQDIPHITRGSSGSSLVCYLLGITDIDPVEHGIDVSRFMHQYREDEPDIDIDFPHYLHNEVHDRVYSKWPGLAYRISNHIHYRGKSSINEARRRLGADADTEEIKELAGKLKGTVRGISKHCGGIVIFDEKPPEDIIIAHNQISFDKRDVEKHKLLKIDLLSNRGLSQLVDVSMKPILEYPEEDALTSALLSSGDSIGVTQAESPAFRKMLRALQPQSRSDIVVAMGLIRPAAASRGRKADFLKNWNEGVTDGLVFEDDASKLISELTGLPRDVADTYRKAFAKGNEKKIEEFKTLVSDPQIIEDLSRFREYSLCKAHGISYGRMVWALAYQKAHNPKEFWYSALKNCSSMYRRWVHIQEAKKAGLVIEAGNGEISRNGDVISFSHQRSIIPMDGWEEYKKYGFWSSNRFMPGCGYSRDGDFCRLRGLVATGRRLKKEDGSYVTFITVGVDTGKYVDLVYEGLVDWYGSDIIEAVGEVKSAYGSEWVQCAKCTTVSVP